MSTESFRTHFELMDPLLSSKLDIEVKLAKLLEGPLAEGVHEENLRQVLFSLRCTVYRIKESQGLLFGIDSGTNLSLSDVRVKNGVGYQKTAARQALDDLRRLRRERTSSARAATPADTPTLTEEVVTDPLDTDTLTEPTAVSTATSSSSSPSKIPPVDTVAPQAAPPTPALSEASARSEAAAGVKNPDWSIRSWVNDGKRTRYLRVYEVTEIKTEDKNAYKVASANKCMQGFAQEMLYLTTAFEMCGTVCGLFVYGSRFIRMRHLHAHETPSSNPHIAVEMSANHAMAAYLQPITVRDFLNHSDLFTVFPWNMLRPKHPENPEGSSRIGDVSATSVFIQYYRSILNYCLDTKIADCAVALTGDAQTVLPAFQSVQIDAVDHVTLTRKARWKEFGAIGSPASRRLRSSAKQQLPTLDACRPPQGPTRRRREDNDDGEGGQGDEDGGAGARGSRKKKASNKPKAATKSDSASGRSKGKGTSSHTQRRIVPAPDLFHDVFGSKESLSLPHDHCQPHLPTAQSPAVTLSSSERGSDPIVYEAADLADKSLSSIDCESSSDDEHTEESLESVEDLIMVLESLNIVIVPVTPSQMDRLMTMPVAAA